MINSGPRSLASCCASWSCAHLGYPCTNTLMGLGALPASDPHFLGMLGMHGTYEANLAMYNCDVMINVGRPLRRPGHRPLDEFSPGSKKIHIDIDPSCRSTRTSWSTCRSSATPARC